jgi:GT2 family glycosyltransferase
MHSTEIIECATELEVEGNPILEGVLMCSRPRLSVVVPVRNRADLLWQTLDALAEQDLGAENFEVVVCDDGSTDDLSVVSEHFRSGSISIRWERQPPMGPAAARNLGVRASSAAIVLFMDSDVIPKPSVLRLLLSALEEHPAWCGAEAALHPIGDEQGILWDAPVSLVGGHYHTAAIAYRREVLVVAGGFDEKFLLPACEDVELAVRVLRHGPIGFVPEAVVQHPLRRVTWRIHWRWRRHWRYVTILALRYGILGFPGNPAGACPRLRLALAAVLTLPTGRFTTAWKAGIAGSVDGVKGMLYAMFDVVCGILALPAILLAPIPIRRDYLSGNTHDGK